jgi:hypothetical protein
MLKETAKADVTLTSNINSRVPEAVTKIIEQTVKEEIKNMLNTCKGDLCNFYRLALDIELSLYKKNIKSNNSDLWHNYWRVCNVF